ncbi:transposase [Nitrosomonas sp.]|uniref:transposase n=1 Tax=Nitrosomonas sp. TaxID=42353 RepID=UPI0026089391|nr:transposase [Nitrosomonas sp.]MCW5602772.1 transposase [Nitrosomonas sp.]
MTYCGYPGRPTQDRAAIARAFVTKMIYNLPTTRALLERLATDKSLRRLCGWENKHEVPDEWTFSRVFSEFAKSRLPERVYEALIRKNYAEVLVGHLSRDSTAIEAREKPVKKPVTEESAPTRRGRPKQGEDRTKQQTRIERQVSGMTLSDMIADLPTACDVGTKQNSKGYKESWIGYKRHLDVADGGIPMSGVLTSASTHDSQVAIPLAYMTHERALICMT